MRPRNTLVTVAEIKDSETTTESGLILPSATGREYKLCEVIAVGPGMITHENEVSPAADLKSGQKVLVKLAAQRRIDRDTVGLESIGVDFRTEDGRDIKLVEQSMIVAIVDDPTNVGPRPAA
jgi:co-chaperonin GroES (HSP10)